MAEFELIFLQLGVGDIDLHLAVSAVAVFVGRGIGDQILRTQLLLNLGESIASNQFRVSGKTRGHQCRWPRR